MTAIGPNLKYAIYVLFIESQCPYAVYIIFNFSFIDCSSLKEKSGASHCITHFSTSNVLLTAAKSPSVLNVVGEN